MNYDLVNEAKYKIYNSELMKYTTTERVEKAILAHMLQNIQLFMKFYIHYLANLTATDIEQ